MKYEKVQIGWGMILIFSIVVICLTISYLMKIGDNPLPTKVFVPIIASFILFILIFYRLKIRVDDEGIHIIYGIGLIHIKINPLEIIQIKIIKTSLSQGLGIRITEKGMLYNIQGRDAIEMTYFNGKSKTVLIGSKDTIALKEFIEKKYSL
ncbi:hypothetical protein ABDJ41_09075 [Pedobacter sp. ASV1-7]|jgi:hypothetical protein|uniref:hypothetical protein n=1 Tax=Pedobacter sp. ASV1-7 TaxID=3145237 RepID=UPI0032E871FC